MGGVMVPWKVARTTTRTVVAAALGLTLLVGCGGEDPDTGDGSSSIGGSGATGSGGTDTSTSDEGDAFGPCPDSRFSEPFIPTDWTAEFVDVCVSSDGSSVQVTNKSTVFIAVRGLPPTQVQEQLLPDLDLDFTEQTNAALEEQLNSSNFLWRFVAPGNDIVAEAPAGQPGQVQIRLALREASGAYAAGMLAGWVKSRLTSPTQRTAQRVAQCASEVGHSWSTAGNYGVEDLPVLLADTALGAGLSCRSLVQDVARESGTAPPETVTLRSELKGVRSFVKATVWSDLLSMLRRAITVHP
jgi:hypothetical protein